MTKTEARAVIGGAVGALSGVLLVWAATTWTAALLMVILASVGLGIWWGLILAGEFPKLVEYAQWREE